MISVRELRKSYGTTVAVDGISFEVARGETFGLLGPNGAGKTTTISLLVGGLRADGGEIQIDGGADPTRAEVRSRLGLAPQSLALYDVLSAEENLAFFGRLYGLTGAALKSRVDTALDFAGLKDRRADAVRKYSGGMQRRLNMACAIVHDPPVLLFDEATVGVDPQSRNHIFECIESLKKQGRTILYTTHYMEEAERLCDRVAIMDHGKLLAVDTVSGLIDRHGGRSVVEARLKRVPADPKSLGGTLDGTTLRLETERPWEEVGRLAASGLEIGALNVHRPDLESVFLALTGRRLRDK